MKLVGYWCPGSSEMYPTQIDPNLLTHLVYCFVGLDHHGELNFGKRDESEATELLEQAILLKKRNPNLKVIAAVGGWSEELVQVWSDLASRPVARAHFADNILNFILAYNLDGIGNEANTLFIL
jgi:GH18 family chitinase